jgi:hypothetical protein
VAKGAVEKGVPANTPITPRSDQIQGTNALGFGL